MRYFALACDYDGTLASEGHVDEETIEALQRVAATGRHLLLVTGRDLEDLVSVFDRLDLFEWIVAENGALIYRPATKQADALCDTPPSEFVAALRHRGIDPLHTGRVIVATREPHEGTVIETIRDSGLELQVIFNKGAVMILPAGVNKATGLTTALERMGLSPHNVAGIGDAENDHAFLSICEYSAAVANALPPLKERADYVTAGRNGAGVREIVTALIENDLGWLSREVERHLLPIGQTDSGENLSVHPFGENLILVGTSGAGKSTLAKSFLERLVEHKYQFCIIDPEGDYEGFEEGVVLGGRDRAPTVGEVIDLIEKPGQNAVVNLLGIRLDDRPSFFARLMTAILEMRSRTGRPHWLVIDEAHHLMPGSWEPASLALPQELYGLLLITVHPDLVSAAALNLMNTIITVGETPGSMISAFAKTVDAKPPLVPDSPMPTGQALIWSREANAGVRPFRVPETRLQHLRHSRKYAEGDLGRSSFYFKGPEGKLNLRAQNLFLFLQTGEGVDEETWFHHLRRGDFSSWLRRAVKNDSLAREVRAIEKTADLEAAQGRKLLREAVEKRYTLPAPDKPAPEWQAPRDEASQVSLRRQAAESNKPDRRRNPVDPVQLIKDDHRKVQQLFQQFENSKEDARRMKSIAEDCIVELQIHEMIEEELFYPAMRQGQETAEIMDEAEEEHHVVDLLIDELLKMRQADGHYAAKFMVMAENVRHHINEEENEMLPRARQLLGSRYETIGDQMMRRKEELISEFGGRPKTKTRSRSRTGTRTASASPRTTSTTRARSSAGARSRSR